MSFAPTLQTERLTLRQVVEDDAVDIFEYGRNPNVLRHTTGRTPTDISQTIMFVKDLANKPDGAYAWSMFLKGSDRVIGVIEFDVKGQSGQVDYAMAELYWNRGLMTETVRSVLAWAFVSFPDMAVVQTAARVENIGSWRVMEKCGMRRVQTVPEKWEKFEEPVMLAVYRIERAAATLGTIK